MVKMAILMRRCKLIMAPLVTPLGCYVLYVFDMENKMLHIMDPANTWQLESTLETKHAKVCRKLFKGLSSTLERYYPGWHLERKYWGAKCHVKLNARIKRIETGFYMLNCALSFDGENARGKLDWESLAQFKMKILQWLGRMDGNRARFPLWIIS